MTNITLKIVTTIITLITFHFKKRANKKRKASCIVRWITNLFQVQKRTVQ
jgi:hypothetical protein